MKKMHGFIGMSVRVCAFVVALVFTSVAFAGCEYLDQMLGGIGLGGGVEGDPEAEPGETEEPGEPEQEPGDLSEVQPVQPESVPEPAGPMAIGGEVKFIEEGSDTYEVHTFREEGTWTLTFSDGRSSVTADCLIVAGGGGAGGNSGNKDIADKGGGGGAGGLLYQAAQDLALTDGSVGVMVGAGGAGGSAGKQGSKGDDSAIGDIKVFGGGGGGTAYPADNTLTNGLNGGSGGGSGARNDGNYGTPGKAVETGRGNNGGRAGNNAGGGGGGWGGAGGNAPFVNYSTPGAGGIGWKPSEYPDWVWVETLTGVGEFSHGGRGASALSGDAEGVAGANPGDGGDGLNGANATGAAGHKGIVIIRIKR